MVKIIPTYECVLESRKKPDDVAVALRWATEEPKMFKQYSWKREFSGLVENRHFRIVQNIDYRNSFQPFIDGCVEESESGSLIHVKMAMHPLISFFCLFFFGGIVLEFLFEVIQSFGEDFLIRLPFLVISTVLIALFQLMMRGIFYSSAKKSIERLKDLLFCYDLK